MPSSARIERGIAAVEAYAADNRHGYEFGSHNSYDVGTDCSGLARMYAAAVEGIGLDGYPDFSTRTMRSVLAGRGWQALPYSRASLVRGDLVLKEIAGVGHVVVCVGNGRIVGAEGNWDSRHGDSSGREVCEKALYDFGWNWILRPPAAMEAKREGIGTAQADETKNGVVNVDDWAIVAIGGTGNLYAGGRLHPLASADEQAFVEWVYAQARAQREAGGMPHVALKNDGGSAPYQTGPWGDRLREILAR